MAEPRIFLSALACLLYAGLCRPLAAQAPAEREFSVEAVARGLDFPWSAAFPSRGSALVTLKGGSILAIDLATGAKRSLGGLPRIESLGQGGLLDIALAPDFPRSRELFMSFIEGRDGKYGTSIARAVYLEGPARLEGWKVIFSGNNRSSSAYNFGSRLAFDAEGYLVATLGDRNERERARDLRDDGGKTVRLDRQGNPAPGDPFLGKDAAPGIFTYGHRNPEGLALNPFTGAMWLHEHGPKGGDEVNILVAGADYGWPLVSYGREYSGALIGKGATKAPGTVQPIMYWVPSIAPSGMAFYTGTEFPSWKGDLLVGALAGKELVRLTLDGDRVTGQTSYLKGWKRIRDVRLGADGRLYLLTDGEEGGLWRLEPRR